MIALPWTLICGNCMPLAPVLTPPNNATVPVAVTSTVPPFSCVRSDVESAAKLGRWVPEPLGLTISESVQLPPPQDASVTGGGVTVRSGRTQPSSAGAAPSINRCRMRASVIAPAAGFKRAFAANRADYRAPS